MKFKPRGLQPHAWVMTRVLRSVLIGLAKFKVANVQVYNRERVTQRGRVIIASNHISIADPVYLWGAVRRNAVALAMAELWRVPGVNVVVWLLGHIPVKRGNRQSGTRASVTAIAILRHEGALIIYPEGKCSRNGELLPFKPGVADLAFATGAPVVPVGISGTNQVMPLGSWMVRPWRRVEVRFGEPLYANQFLGVGSKDEFLDELALRVEALSTN